MKVKKIDMEAENRFQQIILLAIELQDTKTKKLSVIRNIASSIEVLANTELLETLNASIDDYKNGRFTEINDIRELRDTPFRDNKSEDKQ